MRGDVVLEGLSLRRTTSHFPPRRSFLLSEQRADPRARTHSTTKGETEAKRRVARLELTASGPGEGLTHERVCLTSNDDDPALVRPSVLLWSYHGSPVPCV